LKAIYYYHYYQTNRGTLLQGEFRQNIQSVVVDEFPATDRENPPSGLVVEPVAAGVVIQ